MALLTVRDNGPHVVYWSERQVARMRGNEYATGVYYELYDREQRRFVDAFTKACIFPSLIEAEAIACQNPTWRTMPLGQAEELFSRTGDPLPTNSVGDK